MSETESVSDVSNTGAATPLVGGELPEQERFRRQKLEQMQAAGLDPYTTTFSPNRSISSIQAEFAGLEPDARTGTTVKIAGRVMLNRVTGKLVFAQVRDWSGTMQVMISLAEAGEEALANWKSYVDLGDHVGVEGEVITSKRGELSVMAKSFVMTSKCLVPLPDQHYGFNDPEARVRQRYVDLIVNQESRDILGQRAAMVRTIREYLWNREFVEVETPVLQPIHGGANARPFETHINAYDLDIYLRIATELHLKRLLVGGAEKVFEIGRIFRNEGADSTHNPEFTSIEIYEAYGNYETMRVLTQELIQAAAVAVHGEQVVWRPLKAEGEAAVPTDEVDGEENERPGYEVVDISGEWPVVPMFTAISQKLGQEVTVHTSVEELRELAAKAEVALDPEWDAGHVALELYEQLVEETTTTPVFYTDFPTSVSPLTRAKPDEPLLAERWDLVAWGAEIGTAYTELTDPLDQRERLTAQSLLAAAGDEEAMELDDDFLRSLEYGMPPAGGQGMGIDRLIMLLTGKNIRETVLFPLVKPDNA